MNFKFKTEKKIDPKVKFQRLDFKKRLDTARHYKRAPHTENAKPVSSFKKYLYYSLFFLFLFGFVYFFYIPNPFFVKTIVVKNVSEISRDSISSAASSFLNKNSRFFLPQSNLFVLSLEDLKTFLVNTNPSTKSVEKINKKYPSTLEITVSERKESFLVATNSQLLAVSEDGTLLRIISESKDNFNQKIPGLISVSIPVSSNVTVGTKIFSDKIGVSMRGLVKIWVGKMGLPINSIEIPSEELVQAKSNEDSITPYNFPVTYVPEIWIYSPISGWGSNVVVKMNLDEDLSNTVTKLALLMSQMPEERRSKLVYMDMRYKNRGFLCLVGAPCEVQSMAKEETVLNESDINK